MGSTTPKIGSKTAENQDIIARNLLQILNPWKKGIKCQTIPQNGNINCRNFAMQTNRSKLEQQLPTILEIVLPKWPPKGGGGDEDRGNGVDF